MESQAPRFSLVRVFGSLLGIVLMLIVELVLTMLVYTSLNLYSFEFFGQLVRFAATLLEILAASVERLFAGSANAAYASLFGELGPNSILLLLIGLVVASIVRLVVSGIGALRRG